jgi:hypothetical protein
VALSPLVPNIVLKTDPRNLCAYNLRGERFLSHHVEVATSAPISTNEHLQGIPSESGVALWIVLPRDLPTSDVQVLLDLVYLDRNCVVTELVECFPLSKFPESEREPASILALPAMTISRTRTRRGDRLVLGTQEQLKQHLGDLPDSETAYKPLEVSPSIGTNPIGLANLNREAGERTSKPDGRSFPKFSILKPSAEIPSVPEHLSQESAPSPSPSNPVRKIARAAINFWQQWWYVDPRSTSREELPQIVAYFFTGAAPVAHAVQNISLGGLYVVAEERWYLGTIIRLTLSAESEPSAERSIAVNAMVVRHGKDGVGLQFVFPEKENPRVAPPNSDSGLVNVSPAQIEQFLQRFRDGDQAMRSQN